MFLLGWRCCVLVERMEGHLSFSGFRMVFPARWIVLGMHNVVFV